jgi:hypothetical protein
MSFMKFAYSMFILGVCASASFAQGSVVRWSKIVGVITAPGIDNPVGGTVDSNNNATNQIHSGTAPWTTRGGSAHIDLSTGEGSFNVEGLALNGGSASGTPGPILSVVGTLVCNPGASTVMGTGGQTILDTAAVDLSSTGNAELSFKLANVPSKCSTPLFLIRIPQFGLRWIATGTQASTSSRSGY